MHFLRDVAKPVLEADSHAKVPMRKKVRGLRKIEQAMLKRQGAQESKCLAEGDPEAPTPVNTGPADTPSPAPDADAAGAVVLDYCAAVRGILNDDQGGPLQPPGVRMAEALSEVRASIRRNVDEQKGGSQKSSWADSLTASTAASTKFEPNRRRCANTSRTSRKCAATLEPGKRSGADRQETFEALIDRFEREKGPIHGQMVQVMMSFLAGLFVGEGKFEQIRDNLDLERWFRLPKSHERRIHGHRHAGIGLVLEGPTLVPALDAHAVHS